MRHTYFQPPGATGYNCIQVWAEEEERFVLISLQDKEIV